MVIRTCDIGADKTVDYLGLEPEDNPALGLRAIRISLSRKDFFKRQLRALLRASAYGNLAIMFPMIISVDEVRQCKAVLSECMEELEKEGVTVGAPVFGKSCDESDQNEEADGVNRKVEVGIMVETPAAVLCADELAKEVDFFSIGTNDLTQYICAIDRQNSKLEPFLDTHHPAVLRAIDMTVQAAHRNGCWVGICGELASDLSLTETFINMGVDELSVSPKNVLPLRKKIRSMTS